VQPVISNVVRRHERRLQGEDLGAIVMLRVIGRLDELASGGGEPIERLREYVARLARNVTSDLLRSRYPERRRLRRRICTVLARDARFAMWPTPNGVLCGLRAWRGMERTKEAPVLGRRDASDAGATLRELFELAGGPLSVNAVTQTLATSWNVTDTLILDASELPLPDTSATPDLRIENRAMLENLWREVRELRPLQRAVLLLNLRDVDGSNALALLVLLDIATFDEIATAIGLPPESLAAIWSDLPIDDLRIGEMFSLRRQQVINLRQAARQRLGRRVGR
jgi:DNA-directed RNA polymerase specialized sigma24 family protein